MANDYSVIFIDSRFSLQKCNFEIHALRNSYIAWTTLSMPLTLDDAYKFDCVDVCFCREK